MKKIIDLGKLNGDKEYSGEMIFTGELNKFISINVLPNSTIIFDNLKLNRGYLEIIGKANYVFENLININQEDFICTTIDINSNELIINSDLTTLELSLHDKEITYFFSKYNAEIQKYKLLDCLNKIKVLKKDI